MFHFKYKLFKILIFIFEIYKKNITLENIINNHN